MKFIINYYPVCILDLSQICVHNCLFYDSFLLYILIKNTVVHAYLTDSNTFQDNSGSGNMQEWKLDLLFSPHNIKKWYTLGESTTCPFWDPDDGLHHGTLHGVGKEYNTAGDSIYCFKAITKRGGKRERWKRETTRVLLVDRRQTTQ